MLFFRISACGRVVLFTDAEGNKQPGTQIDLIIDRGDKPLHLTMITSYGVEHNAGWQNIQNEVVLDDLFKVE